eukprot:CAMPEP_0206453478 /NCGR_PEP_ID=MMETSP0324_2-20121206/20570_1 /ASSEMBLY_ACC=CAM_ASM_000836 /TAXON_ID=2866 /ORGANISM="Crypthecodinium cohnii, Strain Seligo" /LENGTH=457 /DNA_ID=CAMNT_0053923777 /DNA_START=30 /DNA_END=1403 /DNA_ORIENTATION=+
MAIREDQVAAAVRFLSNESVAHRSDAEKQQFLSQKGLTNQEIAEAVRRCSAAGAGGATSSGPPYTQPAAPASGGYIQPALPPPPPHYYPAPPPARAVQQSSAPWWLTLLSGLSLGSLIALLWSVLLKLQKVPQLMLPAPSPQAAQPAPANASEGSGDKGEGSSSKQTPLQKLEEMAAHMKKHVEETREATASLRRTMESQQRQYQTALSDFQRKLEELQKKKTSHPPQRIEIGASSLKALKSLAGSASVQMRGASPAPMQSSAIVAPVGGPVKEWLDKVDEQLCKLLGSTSSAKEARRVLQTVSMVVHNLVSHPSEEKYRGINIGSTRFKETFGDEAAIQLLELAGFERNGESFTFPAGKQFDDAERVRDYMQDALRECDARWEAAKAKLGPSGVSAGSRGGSASPAPPAASVASAPAAVAAAPAAPWLSSVVQKQISKQGRSPSPGTASGANGGAA